MNNAEVSLFELYFLVTISAISGAIAIITWGKDITSFSLVFFPLLLAYVIWYNRK